MSQGQLPASGNRTDKGLERTGLVGINVIKIVTFKSLHFANSDFVKVGFGHLV